MNIKLMSDNTKPNEETLLVNNQEPENNENDTNSESSNYGSEEQDIMEEKKLSEVQDKNNRLNTVKYINL